LLLEGHALAADPCADAALPSPHTALSARLTASRTASQRAAVQTEAEALTEQGDPTARACAHYLAGTAAFYRSTQRDPHYAAAIGHLVTAQTLAPALIEQSAGRIRLRSAWKRLGALPWATGPAHAVTLQPKGPLKLQLQPDGAGPRLTLDLHGPATVTLRPGRWRITRKHRCGDVTQTLEISNQIPIPAPPACPVRLIATDAQGPVDQLRVRNAAGPIALPALRADAGPLTVDAPGYTPLSGVAVPADGGELRLTLSRCPVDLRLTPEPSDAQIQGGGPAPWGPRSVTASRPGYAELSASVTIPRPAHCPDAHYSKVLLLARPVAIVAKDPSGRAITLGRLVVQGDVVSPTGFARPPGSYSFQATHPEHGLRLGRFTVDPCEDAQGCAPAQVEVIYQRPSVGPSPTNGPRVALAIGGGLTFGGLVAGAAAYSTQRAIDDYQNKAQNGPIDDLIDQRDLNANMANILVGTGLLALTTGLVWSLLSEDP
jgi:hypothetical protein